MTDFLKLKSFYLKKIRNDILYLGVSSFDKKVSRNLTKAIKEHGDKKGIILDLRNNPGGLLDQAINVTDVFVDEGVIVSQKGRDAAQEEKFYAKSSSTLTRKPLIVLVNGGSASASEIVGGALQDHKRAVIVGQKTFGKGSVQVVLPITKDKGEGIKLTIAKYYLPSGRTIQATGITPDIISYPGEAVSEPESTFSIKEADLKKHLEGELEKVDGREKVKKIVDNGIKKKTITKEELLKDNQLKTAVDMLTSLIITTK